MIDGGLMELVFEVPYCDDGAQGAVGKCSQDMLHTASSV